MSLRANFVCLALSCSLATSTNPIQQPTTKPSVNGPFGGPVCKRAEADLGGKIVKIDILHPVCLGLSNTSHLQQLANACGMRGPETHEKCYEAMLSLFASEYFASAISNFFDPTLQKGGCKCSFTKLSGITGVVECRSFGATLIGKEQKIVDKDLQTCSAAHKSVFDLGDFQLKDKLNVWEEYFNQQIQVLPEGSSHRSLAPDVIHYFMHGFFDNFYLVDVRSETCKKLRQGVRGFLRACNTLETDAECFGRMSESRACMCTLNTSYAKGRLYQISCSDKAEDQLMTTNEGNQLWELLKFAKTAQGKYFHTVRSLAVKNISMKFDAWKEQLDLVKSSQGFSLPTVYREKSVRTLPGSVGTYKGDLCNPLTVHPGYDVVDLKIHIQHEACLPIASALEDLKKNNKSAFEGCDVYSKLRDRANCEHGKLEALASDNDYRKADWSSLFGNSWSKSKCHCGVKYSTSNVIKCDGSNSVASAGNAVLQWYAPKVNPYLSSDQQEELLTCSAVVEVINNAQGRAAHTTPNGVLHPSKLEPVIESNESGVSTQSSLPDDGVGSRISEHRNLQESGQPVEGGRTVIDQNPDSIAISRLLGEDESEDPLQS